MPSSYTLGEHFEAFVRQMVESGRYNSASEVLRDGLRLLEDEEKLRELRIVELRRLVGEGRASGISDEDPEAFFDRLDAEYAAMAAERDGT